MLTYESLMSRCDELEAALQCLAREYECPGERMEAFAAIADEILADACRCDDPHDHCIAQVAVIGRLDAMLVKAGWIGATPD